MLLQGTTASPGLYQLGTQQMKQNRALLGVSRHVPMLKGVMEYNTSGQETLI